MASQARVLSEPRTSRGRSATGADRSTARVAESVAIGHLANVQRARILSAMVEVSCELGAGSVTVTDVVKRSGVSRRTFYDMFTDREDCFVASFEQALAFASDRVMASRVPGAGWRQRIRSGLLALLSFFDEEPSVGRLLLVESLAGGPRVAARRTETIAQLTKLIQEGAGETKASTELPALTSEGLVGAVLSVLQSRLLDPTHGPLLALTNELASMIFLPYLGTAPAKRELDRPLSVPEKAPKVSPLLSVDPFKEAHMRLTYRTVRVLTATAEHPGASNRVIADAAEITDQGQISKLLNRLRRNGLIANTGTEIGEGGPNVWTLTQAGEQFLGSIGTYPQQAHESATPTGSLGIQPEEGM